MTAPDLRLYFLTVIGVDNRQIHLCKTVAPSLELAEAQAAAHYGPIELNAWGTRVIDDQRWITGGGKFLPSAHDAQLTSQELASLSS
jgi:hypothetical protein